MLWWKELGSIQMEPPSDTITGGRIHTSLTVVEEMKTVLRLICGGLAGGTIEIALQRGDMFANYQELRLRVFKIFMLNKSKIIS